MNRHLFKIKSDIADILKQSFAWFKEQALWKKIIIVLVVLAAVYALFHTLTSKKEVVADTIETTRAVATETVAALSTNATPIPLVGTVTSVSEANIRGESSGKITVYKKLGDYVYAGTIIASFENSGEKAAVLQAEGAYEQARAGESLSSSTFGESKTQALNTISSVYSTLDDAVRNKTDDAFSDPQSTISLKFIPTVPDASLIIQIEAVRKDIETMLKARLARNTTLTNQSDLNAELATVQGETEKVKAYLDMLALAYSKALANNNFSQASIDQNKASVQAARLSVSGLLSQISQTKNALASAIAQNTNQGDVVSTAGSQVKQALGALQAAQSRLEKTIIRSPISGTINSLSVETGDFVSAFSPVAVVSNNGALEILAYINDDDRQAVGVGSKVKIEGTVDGVVTKIAQAIDPVTRKIEVRIGITGTNGALINGKSVRVDINRVKTSQTIATAEIRLPLSAIKITPDNAYVFTVDDHNKLVAHAVTIGTLSGDQVIILGGVTQDMRIVTDARGLKEGVEVTVKK